VKWIEQVKGEGLRVNLGQTPDSVTKDSFVCLVVILVSYMSP
jgi:hypothetical protein